jgi:hypothetical protein
VLFICEWEKPFLVFDYHLKTIGCISRCCIVLYSMHIVCGCIWQWSVCFIKKRHLLCTVEINFAFASPWLLIFVMWGRGNSIVCSWLWVGYSPQTQHLPKASQAIGCSVCLDRGAGTFSGQICSRQCKVTPSFFISLTRRVIFKKKHYRLCISKKNNRI